MASVFQFDAHKEMCNRHVIDTDATVSSSFVRFLKLEERLDYSGLEGSVWGRLHDFGDSALNYSLSPP